MTIDRMTSAERLQYAGALQSQGFVIAAQAIRYRDHHGYWPDMNKLSVSRLMELRF